MKYLVVCLVSLVLMGCINQTEFEGAGVEQIKSAFDECVANGGAILELDPRQCRDGEGSVFAEPQVRGVQEREVSNASISGSVCESSCGDGVCSGCEEGESCGCAETAISCPEDCAD